MVSSTRQQQTSARAHPDLRVGNTRNFSSLGAVRNLQVVPWFVNLSRGSGIAIDQLVGWPYPSRGREFVDLHNALVNAEKGKNTKLTKKPKQHSAYGRRAMAKHSRAVYTTSTDFEAHITNSERLAHMEWMRCGSRILEGVLGVSLGHVRD